MVKKKKRKSEQVTFMLGKGMASSFTLHINEKLWDSELGLFPKNKVGVSH
jgi:hypothetical protein